MLIKLLYNNIFIHSVKVSSPHLHTTADVFIQRGHLIRIA